MTHRLKRRFAAIAFPVAIVLFVFVIYFVFWRPPGDQPLVVYCAHDMVYAQQVFDAFEAKTGIKVYIKPDSELTKSLGLTELILREKDNPRCDVFWNNQWLGTADLKRRGVLHPYKGSGYQRIPVGFKDPDGFFVGFAARLRVWIVNTDKMKADPQAIEKLIEQKPSLIAIAKPLFGTTLSHYTVLWDLWGGDKLKSWHVDWRQRGVIEKGGNATTKNLVAAGTCWAGLTDTDDYFVAVDAQKPVAMVPVRVGAKEGQEPIGSGGSAGARTILMPNTVAIIKGTQRLEKAQQLVDFLLSEETELMLAASRSRQIPLGPVDQTKLSDQVRQLIDWSQSFYPLVGLEEARTQCLNWLKVEYSQ
jgi:iron(III) transport system substrate-binding protein